MLERRRSDGAAGSALLKRGIQKLQAGAHFEAIRLLGRAQQKLIKDEYRDNLTVCLIACAQAYEQAGLLWAAHSNLLAAASVAFTDFNRGGHIPRSGLKCIQRLVWIEIQLGRIPQAMNYLNFEQILAAHHMLEGRDREVFDEQFQHQDAVLGMLLLRSSLAQLKEMERLPKILERHNLIVSAMALLFALGHEDILIEEGFVPAGTPISEVVDLVRRLANQPAKESLPRQPEIFQGQFAKFQSFVLGCEWTVKVETRETAIRIAEAFLGFVESFFATSLDHDAAPHRQHIEILICSKKSDSADEAAFEIRMDDPDNLALIEYSQFYDPNREAIEGKLQECLRDSLAVLIPRILYAPGFSSYFRRIAASEDGLGRSLLFSNVFASASNVLGTTPGYQLATWLDKDSEYILMREAAVSFEQGENEAEPLKFGEGEAPEGMRDTEGRRHDERRVLSLIDVEAWDRAKWGGVAVASAPDHPPLMGLLFRDEPSARKIFSGWIGRFGKEDEDDKIRVSFLTGIDREHPSSYKIVIGTNFDKEITKQNSNNQFVLTSRIHSIHNPNPRNMEMLHSGIKDFGCYFLLPMIFQDGDSQPRMLMELAILKRELIVRPAWEIGDNDPDSIALSPDDDPAIPEGIVEPPVVRALKGRRKQTD